MFKFVVLLSLVGFTLGAAIPDGMLPQLDGRIVGGTETTITKFPYQISLQRSGSHSCGGSLYSPTIVLTAAHCLQNVQAKSLKVRAGSSSRNSGGTLVQVESFINHPLYNARNMLYDVAIIKLETPLELGGSIRTIDLVKKSAANGTPAVVSGWGTQSSGAAGIPSVLRFVDVKIVDRKKCSSGAYSYGNEIGTTMICAAAVGKDSCQGDSGGPLVTKDGQAGVVSWGYGCAASNYPGVYTDVSVVGDWIAENAQKLKE